MGDADAQQAWTVATLRAVMLEKFGEVDVRIDLRYDQLCERIGALDRLVRELDDSNHRALDIANGAAKDALGIARADIGEKLEKMNEFRGALSDAQATMMPRAEAKLLFDGHAIQLEKLSAQLSDVRGELSNMKGRTAAYTAAIALFFTVATIALRFVP